MELNVVEQKFNGGHCLQAGSAGGGDGGEGGPADPKRLRSRKNIGGWMGIRTRRWWHGEVR